MANNIDNKKPVAICDQSKMDVTKCDINKVVNNIEPLIKVIRGQQVMLDKEIDKGRMFKVTNCDFKRKTRSTPQIYAVCFY